LECSVIEEEGEEEEEHEEEEEEEEEEEKSVSLSGRFFLGGRVPYGHWRVIVLFQTTGEIHYRQSV
jgi:hypothetical protein